MNETQELVFYDRYSESLHSEGIYGEKPLRWAYETTIGRICLDAVIRRKWFSQLYGRWADCGCSRKEVATFIERFEVDASEFLDPPETFQTFNEFFFRKLKAEARPIDP
ncbi:phosphatidylserine decarboxylase, partial [Verrucomicrobiales bacterium]|nr:phosphatidylserine decarboxylase [Verrucomicrobiales bacterium]